MKNVSKYIAGAAVMISGITLTGCALDAPFGDGGDGTLSITTEMNGTTVKKTRAVPENLDHLRETCQVWIENSRGVMRKYNGLDNLPASIRLNTGDYVCNAWAGDSVSASFSEKWYRGQEKFSISENQNTSLLVKCNIANVVVSVDPASLEVGLKDLKVTFTTTRGELTFTEDMVPTEKGYFMTPHPDAEKADAEEYAKNTKISVHIAGTTEQGQAYEKTTEIENAKRAHEYAILLRTEASEPNEGGALINIVIKDIPIIEDTIEVFKAPTLYGVGFDKDDVVTGVGNTFKDTKVMLRGYYELSTATMKCESVPYLAAGVNLLDNNTVNDLAGKGIVIERTNSVDGATEVNVDEIYVTFKESFLNSLAPSDELIDFSFMGVDSRHLTGRGSVSFANTDAAVPVLETVTATEPDENDMMAILATKATLSARIYDPAAMNYGIEYRTAGSGEWTKVAGSMAAAARRHGPTRASSSVYTVTLTGLTPGTKYEYRAYCDGFESEVIYTFTTESKFEIPNASFEEWSTYGSKNIIFPGTGSEPTFWDSGNEGAATIGAVLTEKSSDMAHSGQYSAKLSSKKVAIMLGAGNLFSGDYVRTDGTNGVLLFGRSINGSHPSKMRVWAHYRPGIVDFAKTNPGDMKKGDTDKGQVYVALTTKQIDIRTKSSDFATFDPNAPEVLAYGEVIWSGNFGPDGGLALLEIPLEYKESAKTTKPLYIVLVASASRYGDYFTGSSSSVMYLDDYELIYE